MIEYVFSVERVPDEVTGPSSLTGFIEGGFSIYVNGNKVFEEPEFLIYEFFKALDSWVKGQKLTGDNFYFASMDYEEEPVVAFNYDAELVQYNFDSVFKLGEAVFDIDDIIESHAVFAANLREQLENRFNLFLEKNLQK